MIFFDDGPPGANWPPACENIVRCLMDIALLALVVLLAV
jgi:hypothetical protein